MRAPLNRHDDGVHDWLGTSAADTPSPTLVAAWLVLGMLPTERVPLWAAYWLTNGHDGPAPAGGILFACNPVPLAQLQS